MNFQIRKAERKKAKLRIGISAPSGAGKTYSALLLAKGIVGNWSKIGVIDTENGSGELYSHLGEYNVITLEAPYTPEMYIGAIKAFEDAEMQAIIIDSASHEWDGKGGCLEINEKLAQTKFRGNSWAAWSETTPRHQRFIEAITTSPVHIITTARSKTDMIQTEDRKIKKVGMKDIQREGFEYELTLAFNLDRDSHYAIASKDRTEMFIDKDPFLITEETGKQLKEWADSGKEDTTQIEIAEKRLKINELLKKLGTDENWLQKSTGKLIKQLNAKNLDSVIDQLETKLISKMEKEKKAKEAGEATPEELKQIDKEVKKETTDLSKTMTNSITKNKKNE